MRVDQIVLGAWLDPPFVFGDFEAIELGIKRGAFEAEKSCCFSFVASCLAHGLDEILPLELLERAR